MRHFLDNKFRRANSGSLPIAEKGRDAVFCVALRVFVPYILENFETQSPHVRPNLKKSLRNTRDLT